MVSSSCTVVLLWWRGLVRCYRTFLTPWVSSVWSEPRPVGLLGQSRLLTTHLQGVVISSSQWRRIFKDNVNQFTSFKFCNGNIQWIHRNMDKVGQIIFLRVLISPKKGPKRGIISSLDLPTATYSRVATYSTFFSSFLSFADTESCCSN